MGHRRATMAWGVGLVVTACATVMLVFGGSAAAGGVGGDSFYFSKKKKTFVSFMIRAGSDEVSRLAYSARKLPCTDGSVNKGGMAVLDRTAPLQENLLGQTVFEAFWAPGHPSNGGIAGTIGDSSVKGELDLRINRSRKVSCESGLRKWTADSVSEEAWLAAREAWFGQEPPPTPRRRSNVPHTYP